MTYEDALEIAMEELYDAVEDLRYNNKGYQKHIEGQCNRLLTARNAIHKGLEDAEKKREWVGLTEQERNDLEDYCEMIIGKAAFDAIEAKLKELNNERN